MVAIAIMDAQNPESEILAPFGASYCSYSIIFQEVQLFVHSYGILVAGLIVCNFIQIQVVVDY